MGNHHSSAHPIDNSTRNSDFAFKVDNINSYGRKHSSAKIQLVNENLCIHQKHRQSLFIPLNTIKRYGLDGSIFILECGRRAPLGQARYAFRCKKARQLVTSLDQRITMISNQLVEEQQDKTSLSLTNVSSMLQNIRRTQSLASLSSATSFYRNSQPELSENYFHFHQDNDDYTNSIEINYAEFHKEKRHSNEAVEMQASTEMANTKATTSSTQPEDVHGGIITPDESVTHKSYVFIDHEKTTTLKEIAQERLQQHFPRFEA